MRIGIDATSVLDELSGAEAHVFTVVEALRSHAVDEVVLFVRGRMPEAWTSLPERFTGQVLRARRQELATQVLLPLAARRAGIDVLYCPAKPPPATISVPVVAAIHDTVPWRLPHTMGRGASLWYRTFHRIALRRGAVVATVSEAAKKDLCDHLGIPPSQVHVVGNSLAPWLLAASAGRTRPEAPAGAPYVFSLCRIEPRKDLSTVLDAWEVIRGRRPDLRLLLGGKVGWKVHDVVERARAMPGVEVLGAVDNRNVPDLYANASAFVTASRDEGFGLPVLEAMHFGAPVVASRIAAHVEVAGDSAVFFEPGDTQGLATGVLDVLTDEDRARELRESGTARAGYWSHERLAARLVSACRAAMGQTTS